MINKQSLLIILLVFFPLKSLALIEVDITRGNLTPLPVAVSSLSSSEDDRENLKKELDIKDLGLEISKVVENNLQKKVKHYENYILSAGGILLRQIFAKLD